MTWGENAGREQVARGAVVTTVIAFVAAAFVTVGLDVVNALAGVPSEGRGASWPSLIAGLPQAVLGVTLLRTHPRLAVAWLLTASGVGWLLDALCFAWLRYALYVDPIAPGAGSAAWFTDRFGVLLIPLMAAMVMVFPDGHLPGGRWVRIMAVTALCWSLLYPFAVLAAPESVLRQLGGEGASIRGGWIPDHPVLNLPHIVWQVCFLIGLPALYAATVLPLATTLYRYRHANQQQRAQIRWLMWAALTMIFVVPLSAALNGTVGELGLTVPFGLVAVAVAVAVTRHRLYDIDRLLPATLIYGALAGSFVLLDAVVVAVAGSWLTERGSALAAMALLTASYVIGRDALWRWVRRILLGRRADAGTVTVLARSLENATGVEEQLRELTHTLTASFKLSYVAVRLDRQDGTHMTVNHGTRRPDVISLPIAYRGEPVGRLDLDRRDRSQLGAGDQRLLGDLVRQAAAAARATDINASLRRARTDLVLAREEERRRLRRDLHDGLGPSLGAIRLRIETARNLAAHAPGEANEMLDEAAQSIGTALAEMRHLVYDLRPPALDELGLAGAVREQAERLRKPGLRVRVRAANSMPPMPAAVEVAALRIVAEALTNVVRHAEASYATITLDCDAEELRIEVTDDGRGIQKPARSGVGLISMRERAAELGGCCEIAEVREGGTTIRCRLPRLESATAPIILRSGVNVAI